MVAWISDSWKGVMMRRGFGVEEFNHLGFCWDDWKRCKYKRLWDMRNIMTPVKEFTGHTKGVIAMVWCPIDSSYLINCAKDSRTICWDTVSGEIVSELPTGTNWNFDVHWYPKIPGIISASSFDGKIGIYNIEVYTNYIFIDLSKRFCFLLSLITSSPLRVPKWYKRPAGASFGFGGKLVGFRPRPSAAGVPAGASEVYVHTLVTEDSLVSRSSKFEAAIPNGERSLLRVLCEKKSQETESENDRETWNFLKVMFEDDGTERTKLLSYLGFSVPTKEKDGVEDLSQEVKALELDDSITEKVGYGDDKEVNVFPTDNGEDFFNNLSPAGTPVSTSHGENFAIGDTALDSEQLQQEPDGFEESTDPAFDDAVQIIANVGGASLWESTRDQCFKISQSPYLKVVSAMVNNDLLSLVNTRLLKFWKETLALLCSFAQREEWTMLCDTLASKLMTAGNTLAATLCYICAGNIDKTVEIWSRCLRTEHEGKSYVELLQDLIKKTIVLALATGQKRFSASLCKLVEKYAEILASQGLLTTAMDYLKLLGSDELSPELVILRDQIALATEPGPQLLIWILQILWTWDSPRCHLVLLVAIWMLSWMCILLVVLKMFHQMSGSGSSIILLIFQRCSYPRNLSVLGHNTKRDSKGNAYPIFNGLAV
nr:protein transport protein sec31 like b [Quercus suber]